MWLCCLGTGTKFSPRWHHDRETNQTEPGLCVCVCACLCVCVYVCVCSCIQSTSQQQQVFLCSGLNWDPRFCLSSWFPSSHPQTLLAWRGCCGPTYGCSRLGSLSTQPATSVTTQNNCRRELPAKPQPWQGIWSRHVRKIIKQRYYAICRIPVIIRVQTVLTKSPSNSETCRE